MANNQIDYSKEYFTIVALEDGLTVKLSKNTSEYRIDNGEWISLAKDTATSSINSGQKISFKITNPKISQLYGIGTFTVNKAFNVDGNIMSLLYGDNFDGQIDLSRKNYAFAQLFDNCTTLKNTENLILPATTLASNCYGTMFNKCTSLTTAPKLPATTLASTCYNSMFGGCTSLTTAPELPATTLANNCYFNMFNKCTSLTTAPELPATTLTNECYRNMFGGCTSLTTAPELPATTLTTFCYSEMFGGCTSLTTAPELPATTLVENCYAYMFQDCSKLNKITMLATDISASNCLRSWVSGVASSGTFVKNAAMASLPSGDSGIPTGWTVVNIFNNVSPCIINHASESITFVYNDGLFTPTNEIIELSQYFTKEELLSAQPECEITVNLQDKFDNVLASDYVWTNDKTLSDVLNELGVNKDVYNINVIITNVNAPEESGYYYYYMLDETEPFVEKDWIRIVSLEDGNTISLSKDIQYSVNGDDWRKLYANNTITVNSDDIVYFKGTNTENQFTVSKAFNVEGNIMSLLYGNNFEGQNNLSGKNNAFRNLFVECTTLQNAANLILSATTLAEQCYYQMFSGCTSLTTAPELPATTLASNCYQYMFNNCTSLTTAPELPATILANNCYLGMFMGCTSLTKAPELPATTLASNCYGQMFQTCTNLAIAPVLPATTLASYCYQNMFYNCSKLNKITMLATDINTSVSRSVSRSASNYLTNWVKGVPSNGTFIKNAAMTSLPSGDSGIPTGWTVVDYNENMGNKKYLDKAGLEILWGIIKEHLAAKADKSAAVGSFSDTDYTATDTTITVTAVDGTTELDKIVLASATTDNAGFMSAEDKANLDSLKETIDANTDFKGLKINDVQIATADAANLKIEYVPKTETTNAKIKLYDTNNENAVSEIDASDFIKDGMISSVDIVEYQDKKQIKLEWNTDAGINVTYIPVDDMVKTYSAGEGLTLSDNEFSLKTATATELGGIKTNYVAVEGEKKYAVTTDNDDNAYVNVPWKNDNTEYTVKSGNTLVELELSDTEFSIDETALAGAIESLQTTKIDSADGDDYITASVTGTEVKVYTTDALKDAVTNANSAVQSANGDDYINATVDGTEVKVAATDALKDAVTNANDAIKNINGVTDDLVTVTAKSNNEVSVYASNALKDATDAANSAVQSAEGDDYIAASVDGTEVKVYATDTLTGAVTAANSALQEINISSITLSKTNNTVEHDEFVGVFVITEDDIEAICK